MKNDTEIDIVTHEGKKITVNRRRLDARIWGALSDEQQDKAERLATGYMIATNGLGAATASYEYTGHATSAPQQSGVVALLHYKRWVTRCLQRGVDPFTTLQVLVHGQSYATVDRTTGKRRHTTRQNMMAALEIYE
jgi:hypothetical protein